MDERRLHFPIHGTRLSGDGDPARGVGEAARLLYFVNLIAETAGVPVFQLSRQTPYGAVTASVHGPLAFKSVHSAAAPEEPQEEVTGIARLVWLPEGFVITPRTAGAPDGFGMPPTPAPPPPPKAGEDAPPRKEPTPFEKRGTPGGPLKQVIINRFKDNQYPDAVYRWGMEQAGMKPGAGRVIAGNLFMMDWELDKESGFGIGIVLSADGAGEGEFLPQFDKRWVPNYAEPDSGEWHCHRPELYEGESELQALIRQETNLLREEVGRTPLGKPLRGTEGQLSEDILYQMRYSGVMWHDSPLFRIGHGRVTADERFALRSAFWHSGGENVLLDPQGGLDAEFARTAVREWRDSPEHYAEMTRDWHRGGEEYAWIDPAISASGKAAADGALGVQIFGATSKWVESFLGVRSDGPIVGVAPLDMFVRIFPQRYAPSSIKHTPHVNYRGRAVLLFVPDFGVSHPQISIDAAQVLAGAMLVEDGEATKLRVAVLERPHLFSGPASIAVYEGVSYDFYNTRQEIGRYQLPFADAGDVSAPTWSQSGARMAFCFTTVRPAPFGRIENSASSSALPTSFVGQQLHFVEFSDGVFVSRGTDSLKVDPSDFGPTHRNSSCAGTVRYLPVYAGEELDYVRIAVDSYMRYSTTVFEKRAYGALLFPGGAKVIYSDVYAMDENAGEVFATRSPISGYVRHILPFDVRDPASVAYVQYDHPAAPEDLGISAKLVIRGDEIKSSPLAYDDGLGNGPRYRTPWAFSWGIGTVHYTPDAFRGNPYWTAEGGRGLGFTEIYRAGLPPSVPFDGLIVSDSNLNAPSDLTIGPFGSYVGPHPSRPYATDYVLVGPTLLRTGSRRYERLWEDSPSTEQAFDRIEEFSYANYKGDWIYAGRIENTLGGTGEYDIFRIRDPETGIYGPKTIQRSMWLGDDQYYCHSSLDLKTITGLPDLKDNILPIGVL